MNTKPKRIVIAGAGITGLASAYYLHKFFQEKNIPVEITLLEKDSRLGGKINTLYRDGFVIERGPDSFLGRKMPIIHLTRELGLENELTGTNPKARKNYILHKGKLHLMPPGLMLGIPTQLAPFLKTGLLSPLGKLRAGLDLVLPKRKETGDQSLGDFIKRRLGSELHDRLVEPLLAGIYAGDTSKLSLRATFPQFEAAEQKHRSLILGMLANKRRIPVTKGLPELAKKSMFLTYTKGLTRLINRLEEVLSPKVRILKETALTSITKSGQGYTLTTNQGMTLTAEAVILALPAPVSASLLEKLASTASLLHQVNYVSVANVVLAYDADQIKHPLDASGFVVPNGEGLDITACTWTSSKWLHTAPPGKVLLRCYVGREGAEEIVFRSDEEILQRVRRDIKATMGIEATPIFHEITRLPHSMPQYPVGHLEHLQKVRDELAEKLPGIILAGSGFQGVGIPDCVGQGETAAKEVYQFLTG